jgi:hypothetical protein
MDAAALVTALGLSLKKNEAQIPQTVQPATWTSFMKGCLLDLAETHRMHVCAEGLGRMPGRNVDPGRHLAAEFLFDFTVYKKADWEAWSLPSIIIEHENQWTETAFLQDFWKLLIGHAPLRVMFGYARRASDVDSRVRALFAHERTSRWTYPLGTEDLVLLRCPERGGMPWPDWRIVYRPAGGSWNDLKVQTLDGVSLAPRAADRAAAARAELRRSQAPRASRDDSRTPRPERWSRSSFMKYVRDNGVGGHEDAFMWLIDLCERFGQPARWGAGRKDPTLQLRAGKGAGRILLNLYGGGTVVVRLDNVCALLDKPAANELRAVLNRIPGIAIAANNYRSPNLDVALFTKPEPRRKFTRAIEAVVEAVRAKTSSR